jgi:hypothetical protein
MEKIPKIKDVKTVSVDPGGYGISWSDDIDLSEYGCNIRECGKGGFFSHRG